MRRAELRYWLDATDLKPSRRLVYAALWAHSDAHGWTWPSQGRLVADTGLARSTVQRALYQLTTLGDIVPKPRAGASTAYYLPVGASDNEAPPLSTGASHSEAGVPHTRIKPASLSEARRKEGNRKDARSHQNGAPASPHGAGAPVTTDHRGTFLQGTGWVQ